jgi:hypothetical protein
MAAMHNRSRVDHAYVTETFRFGARAAQRLGGLWPPSALPAGWAAAAWQRRAPGLRAGQLTFPRNTFMFLAGAFDAVFYSWPLCGNRLVIS